MKLMQKQTAFKAISSGISIDMKRGIIIIGDLINIMVSDIVLSNIILVYMKNKIKNI